MDNTTTIEKDFKDKVLGIMKDNIYFSGQIDGYVVHGAIDKIWQLAASLQTPCAGWVKASERLPGWNKEVKWRHPSAEIVNELMWTSVAMELCSHLITDLEWLDESQCSDRVWLCECKKEHGFTLVAGYSYCNNCGKRY